MPDVHQAEIADAEIVVPLQVCGIAGQRVAVLHPEERDEFAGRMDTLRLCDAARELDAVRVVVQHPPDGGVARHRLLPGNLVTRRAKGTLRREQDEEGGIEPAGLHFPNVDLEIVPAEEAGIAELLHRQDVDMGVQREQPLMQRARVRQDDCRCCCGERDDEEG